MTRSARSRRDSCRTRTRGIQRACQKPSVTRYRSSRAVAKREQPPAGDVDAQALVTPRLPQGSAVPPSAVPPMAAATGEAGRDELDPELLALPDPPHRARTFTVAVLILASIAALSMVVTLRHDVTY